MRTMHLWIGAVAAIMTLAVAVPQARADGDHDRGWGMLAQERHRDDRGFDRGDRGDRREHAGRGERERRDRFERRDADRGHRPGYVLDRRYHHDRYYPPRGYVMRALPHDRLILHHHGRRYYYWGGIWYRSSGLGFVVVTPPFGIMVPMLPPYYTTVWVAGVPYYYADGVYYVWRPAAQGYVVTEPPGQSNVVTQAPGPDQFYVYPEKGQSPDQQAKDRYECHRWAVGQTGFDPSQSVGNLPGSQLVQKRTDYRRAIEACLDARGYSVK